MAKEFEVRFQGVLPASAGQVWDAITGGTAGWLWPIDYEPRLGGSEAGLTPNGGTVTAWDPPGHFATRGEGADGWHNNLDYRLEPRGGETYLRFVHSGVIEDNFDTEYDACRQHTAFYYHSLGEYLTHFQGRSASYLTAEGPAAAAEPDAFEALRRVLGVSDQASPGERVRLEVPGLETLDGVVDYLTPSFVGLRTADALYRFYGRNAFGWRVGLGHHLFGDGVDQEKAGRAWTAWLDGVYA